MNLNLAKIKIDGGTQSRAKIDENVVAEYAESMKDGDKFPPVVVFHDGAEYFLADGFHRYFAAKRAGSPGINCDVHEGTLRDAILYSFGANDAHGLRRTSGDKRKSVMTMLTDIEWQDWSDREIARQCRVSHPFVANMRKEVGNVNDEIKFKRKGKENSIVRGNVTMNKKTTDENFVEAFSEAEVEREEMQAAVQALQKKNEDLQDELTIAMAASADEIEKEKAQSIIKDLRAQIRLLEIELKAVTISRDQFQSENAQLMKQVQMLQKKLKKLESK